MLNLNDRRIDQRTAQAGVWHDISFLDNGEPVHIRLKLALADMTANKEYYAHMQKLTQPHQRAIELGVFDKTLELNRQAIADVIIKDWEGIGDGEGNPQPYTPAGGMTLLENYPEVLNQVQTLAKDAAAYRQGQRESAVGNSEHASDDN